eukprot:c9798_g1_i2.p1 GENE.c9798_g1_i2~~c9798_g1_i2.p1  ORF type:complete len:509 (+),score=118.59 c9798_g1_i2:46-1527(+)
MDDDFARKLSSPRRKSAKDRLEAQMSAEFNPGCSETSIADSLSHPSGDAFLRSPTRKSTGDRFIPRRCEIDPHTQFSLGPDTPPASKEEKNVYNSLLRASLGSPSRISPLHTDTAQDGSRNSLLNFSTPTTTPIALSSSSSPVSPVRLGTAWHHSSQRFSQPQTPKQRKISTVPYKVLDAPSLQDDFYLNLVDWSSNNILAVALGSAVYLWNAYTGMVTQCFSSEHSVSAVAWVQKGTHLAIGLSSGKVEIFDTNPCKRVRTMSGHDNRVGALCWNGCMLTSGSRDHKILNRDTTSPSQFTSVLSGHKQEVCGLKWSPDGTHLASGGNDNKLLLWSAARQNTFYRKYSEHTAAVKAIAWSPHEAGILVSGGGTADRTLRFWNINHATSFKSIDSGSQVCNLGWSQNVNEIVSTHGYSQNQIVLWRYPSMARIATLTGHTTRVLFLAISPDGQNIVTGAGDENLRFWHVWPAKKADNENRDVRGTLSTIGSQIR